MDIAKIARMNIPISRKSLIYFVMPSVNRLAQKRKTKRVSLLQPLRKCLNKMTIKRASKESLRYSSTPQIVAREFLRGNHLLYQAPR